MSGRRRAAVKLTALLVLGVAVFRITSVATLVAMTAAVTCSAAVGRVTPRALWGHVRVVTPMVAVVFTAHGLLTGWSHAAAVALRLIVVVLAATAVSCTTRVSDMIGVVEVVCRPLRWFGVDPTRVALVLAMAIRLVPLLGARLAAIRQAHRARGVERPGPTVLTPLLVGTLRMADDLADALDARGLADARDARGGGR